jgi:DNA-binding NarL/FixJ family response regulator
VNSIHDASTAESEGRGFPAFAGDRPLRVLLIEDDASHARIALRSFDMLEGHFELSLAANLREARESIGTRAPDLVIADLVLPDGRGTDLISDGGQAAFPVLVLTSHGDERIAVEALKAGALDYIVKSSETLFDLPQVARRAMREWEHIRGRRSAERRLEENERRHRAVLDSIPDLIFVIATNGELLDCRGGRRDFGIERPEQYAGANLQRFVHPETFSALSRTISDVLSTQEIRTLAFELMLDDRPHHVEARIAPYDRSSVLSILRDVTVQHEVGAMLQKLTPREREVLHLVAEGRSNKQMAARLDLSVKTVEAHRARLMRKLGTRNMAELMKLALSAQDFV